MMLHLKKVIFFHPSIAFALRSFPAPRSGWVFLHYCHLPSRSEIICHFHHAWGRRRSTRLPGISVIRGRGTALPVCLRWPHPHKGYRSFYGQHNTHTLFHFHS